MTRRCIGQALRRRHLAQLGLGLGLTATVIEVLLISKG